MASVGLEAVRNAQALCMGAIQDLNSASAKLKSGYQQAGQQWKDKKYEQLGGIVNDCERAMKSPIQELFECVEKLKNIETVLNEYDSTNL